MSGWSTNPSWNSLESINGGFKFTSIDDVSPSDFNRLVENMQFLYTNLGGELDMKRIYPVGSIYLSLNKDVSPAELFGGTWESLKDRFLLGASDAYVAGTTGGSATHTLKTVNMPGDTMGIFQNKTVASVSGIHGTPSVTQSYGAGKFVIAQREQARSLGYDDTYEQPVNHMPPYLAVYMWKRTA